MESWKGAERRTERPGYWRAKQQEGKIIFSHYAPDFPEGKVSSGWVKAAESKRDLSLWNRVTPRRIFSGVWCGDVDQSLSDNERRWGKGNYFPLLKIWMEMKSILLSDWIGLRLGNIGRNSWGFFWFCAVAAQNCFQTALFVMKSTETRTPEISRARISILHTA